MFDSGISAKDLIEELKNTEVDIALEIPNATYVEWLNALQQLVYTEIIKEQEGGVLSPSALTNPIDVKKIPIHEDESVPRFEDIYAVYADDVQLIKSTLTSGVIFPNTYYKVDNNIGYNTSFEPTEIKIIHIVRPALITVSSRDVVDDSNVMLPIEFIELAKSKLRGEAYKLANEDSIAGKWLNDYNTLLETFKAWVNDKTPTFGI